MKIYVINKENSEKIYLDYPDVKTRQGLKDEIGSEFFTIDGVKYSINNVFAESSSNHAVSGAIIGGIVGIIAGPIGVIAGGAIGSLFGKGATNDDKEVNDFNRNKI